MSGYSEAKADGEWGKYNFISGGYGRDKLRYVPVLKPENFGREMAVDEKMIDEDFYTVMTNRQTGKIALLAQTVRSKELEKLIEKIPEVKDMVQNITCDLSPTYEKFCNESFAKATQIADKFHVIRYCVEALQAVRIRIKQQIQSDLPKDKKERKEAENASRLANGETPSEMLTRSRYLLFKRTNEWKEHQKRRAELLFETFPELRTAYQHAIEFRQLLDKKNIGAHFLTIDKQWATWHEHVEDDPVPEMENLSALVQRHEKKIRNYLIDGHTNAKAENMNSKIQRFITANYGTRDHDFFLFRVAKYFS